MSLDFKVRRTLLGLSFPQSIWNPVWLSPMSPDFIQEVFESPLSAEELYSEALALWNANSNLSLIDKTLEFYTNFYLIDDILVKVDRAAMMNSLESRAVLLDNDLVEFVRRLPSHFKIRNGQRKYIFKRAIRGLVPQNILDRPKKGFGIPLRSWLSKLAATSNIPLAGLDTARMNTIIQQQKLGQLDERLAIWAWLTLRARLDGAGRLATMGNY